MNGETSKNLPANQDGSDSTGNDMVLRVAEAIGAVPSKAAKRLLKGLFRVTLMSSDTVLDKYLETKERIDAADREALRKNKLLELREKEAETWLELLKGDGNIPVDRFEDIETLSRKVNVAGIVRRSLEHLQDAEGNEDEASDAINECWMDRFIQFASTKNEPWRAEILSACLAKEAETQGSVSIRALWNIAMLEAEEFYDLSDFVNLSAKLYRDGKLMGFYMVGYYAQLIKSDYVGADGVKKTVSNLFDKLEALDLLALGHGDIDLMKSSGYELHMDELRYAISMADNPPKDVADAFLEGQNAPPFGREDSVGEEGRYSLHAMPLTRIGNELAALLDWNPTDEAIRRFEEALHQQNDNLQSVGV